MSKIKKYIVFIFSIIGFAITGCFGGASSNSSSSVKQGVVPTYTGMTISRNYVGNTTSQVILDEESNETLPLNGNDDDPNVNYDNHGRPHVNNGNKSQDKEEIETDVEELEDLEVLVDDTFRYYVTKGEIFTIEVHIDNPNDYEIQSFTLNGQKYANYMFKVGSTMELLLLDVEAPMTSGHLEYTIDAIKYIDGTEIKDVKIGGEKTVKAGVKYENEPTALITNTQIKDTSVTIDFQLNDPEELIKDNEIVFYLSDGDEIIDRKNITLDSTTVTFTDLNMGKLYQYGIFTSYDLVDGENVKERCLVKDTFTTLKSYSFKNLNIGKESVDFELDSYASNGTLKYIAIFDVVNNYELVESLEDLSIRRFENLLSNRDYLMKVLFEYNLKGEIIEEADVVEFKTLEKVTPTVSVTNLNVYSDYVEFEPLVTDIDSTGSLTAIELYKDNVLVDSKTDLTDYCFYGLLSSTSYELVLKYTYNLNDGGNDRVLEVRQEFTTLGKLIPTVSIENIETGVDNVTFDINIQDTDNVGKISKVELYLDNELVQTLEDFNNLEFTNLLSNSRYKIKVTYTYDLNDGTGLREIVVYKNFSTQSKAIPSVSIENIETGVDNVTFEINVTDIDNVGEISKVELYLDNELVYSLTDFNNLEFKGLLVNCNYQIRVTYEYDLNDGNGICLLITSSYCSISEYIIYFETNGGELEEYSQKVIYGLEYTLPTPTKTGYTFSGWEYDGEDFEEGIYNYWYDITVYAKWTANKYNVNYYDGEELIKSEEATFDSSYTFMSSYMKDELTLVKLIIDGKEYNPATVINYNYANDIDVYLKFYELNNDYTYSEYWYSSTSNSAAITGYTGTDTELVIPEYVGSGNTFYKVVAINDSAFYENYDITSVTMLDNIERIHSNAFYKCISLVEVNLPNSLVRVDWGAFAYCTNLEEIILPDSLEYIEGYIFTNCTSLVSITIPSKITDITSYMFQQCVNLVEVVLHDNITSIGYAAFEECKALENIILPNCLTTIRGLSFENCYNLNKIVIPASVKVIEEYAFNNCYNLSIYLNTETIPTNWNENWNSSNCFVCVKGTWTYEDGIPVGNKFTVTLDANGGELEDETFVVTYGEYNELPVPIKKGYTFTGWYLNGEYFDGVLRETNDITLVASWSVNTYTVTYQTEKGAIEGWDKEYYTYITYGDYFEPTTNIWGNDGYTFSHWTYNGERFDSQTYIYDHDITLVAVWTPNSYTISFDTYGGELEEYTMVVTYDQPFELPTPTRSGYTFNGWTYNGEDVDTSKYTYTCDIWLQANWIANTYNVNYYDGEELIKSEEAIYDSSYTFMSSYMKDELTLVKLVIDGEEYNPATELYSFNYAKDINVYLKFYKLNNDYTYDGSTITGYTGTDTELVIPEYVGSGNTYYKVNRIGYQAFYENYDITSIILLDNIEYIDGSAFAKCISLVEVNLSNGLKEINYDAFRECESLVNIVIPDTVIYIGTSAFNGCKSLEEIVLPSELKTLGEWAFYNCDKLTSIVIPESVTSIGDSAFSLCSSLTSITLPSTLTKISSGAFDSCTSLINIEMPNTITSIGNNAFNNCTSLEEIVLPTGLKQLGEWAFHNCDKLTSIVIPEGVKVIESYTFYDCNNLESVTLPSTLTTIRDDAFNNCTNLDKLVIPESVKVIEENAFYNCYNLSIFLNVESIPSTWSENWLGEYSECKVYLKDTWHYENETPVGNKYTIIYDTEGGELEEYTQVVSYNSYFELPTPTKVGHIFVGWYLDGEYYGYKAILFDIAKDITLVAEWMACDYAIYLEPNEAFHEGANIGVTYGQEVTLPVLDHPGFTFNGWMLNGEIIPNTFTYLYTESITLVASLTSHTFVITYDANGGELEEYTQEILYAVWTELYVPTRKGYTFEGWYLNGEYFAHSETMLLIAEDITVVAEWSVNTYKVTYNPNGGYVEGCEQWDSYILYDSYFEVTSNIWRDGYTFQYWTLNGERFDSQYYLIDSDITLVAVWTPNRYTITFETYGGTLEEYTQVVTYDQEFTLPTPTRSGYTFNGWEYNGELFENDVYDIYGDIWVYARWIANTYNVNYYDGEELIKSEEAIYDSSYTFMSSYMKDELTLVKLVIDGEEYNPATELYSFNYAKDINVYLKFYKLNNDYTYDGSTITGYTGSDTELVIPEYVGSGNTFYKVNAIGYQAFYENYDITSVTLLDNIEYIDGYAFAKCISLVEVNLSNTLKEINYEAFKECESLVNIVIPDTVIKIENSAFNGCKSLEEIVLPSELETLGEWAFYNCDNLTSIVIPEGVKVIEGYTFYDCNNLESVTLPSTLTTIRYDAFNNCTSLEEIVLPTGLKTLGEWAFHNCDKLTSIVIPEGVKVIESYTFYDCNNLESVILPSTLTTIRYDAFNNCTNLDKLVIPSSVKVIEENAFNNCYNLSIFLNVESIPSTWSENWLGNSNCKVYTKDTWQYLDGEPISSYYQIWFYAYDYDMSQYDRTVKYGEEVELPVIEHPGYIFNGWIVNGEVINGSFIYNFTEDLIIEASVTFKQFVITFDTNGGELEEYSKVVTFGEYNELPIPTKKGHTFAGWYLNDEYYYGTLFEANDITLVAKWSVNTYEVTYNAEPGWVSGNSSQSIVYGEYLDIQSEGYRDGYTFQYWTYNGERFDSQTYIYDHDITLVAVWTPNNYTISFDTYGGELEEYTMVVTYDESYELPTPKRTGYTFAGWEYNGEDFEEGIYNYSYDIWLQANWIANTYNVNYYDGEELIKAESIVYDSSYTFMSSYMKDELTLVKLVIDGEEYNPATVINYNYANDIDVYLKFYKLNNDYTYDGSTITGYTGSDTELVIPEYVGNGNTFYKVNAIGYQAFYENYDITSVTMLDNIEYIGGYAFYKCISLVEVNLSNNLVNIEYNAFEECTSLVNIVLPDSLTELSSSIFSGCRNLVNVTLPSNLTIIGSSLFSGCISLVNIEIPNTVTTIEGSAFNGCTLLKDVVLPSGLIKIENHAFAYCESLTTIVIPQSVKNIEDYVFYETGIVVFLNTTEVPSSWDEEWDISVRNICFSGTWHYEDETPVGNEYTITYDANGGELEEYTQKVTYASDVELYIPTRTGYTFTGWYLNDECYGIDNAFVYVASDVTLVASWRVNTYRVTYDADGGWINGSSIQTIVYGEYFEIQSQGVKDGYTFQYWSYNGEKFDNQAYLYDHDITLVAVYVANEYTITFETYGGELEDYTLVVIYDQSYELPTPTRTGYTFIGWTYYGEEVDTSKYTYIGDIYLQANWTANKYIVNYYDGETLINSEEVAYDSSYTLMSSYTKEELTLIKWIIDGEEYNPATEFYKYTYAHDLDIYAKFYELNNDYTYSGTIITGYKGTDTELVIPEYVGSGNTFYKVNAIGSSAFNENHEITSVTMLDNIEYIENYAFYKCISLVEVNFSSKLETIENYAFNECTSLVNINLPETLTLIGEYAFGECISLSEIILPNSITTLGHGAFYHCQNLINVTLPNSLTKIASNLFDGCSKLENIELPDTIVSIGNGAFGGCKSLTNIELPSGLKSIEEWAFNECDGLTSIVIPEGIKIIEAYTFFYSDNLETVILPSTLTTIKTEAFICCTSLTNIIIPESVKIIGSRAFGFCDNLSIYLNVNSIPSTWDEEWNYSNCNVFLKDTWHYEDTTPVGNEYTITFDAAGGEIDNYTQVVTYNDVIELPTPTKLGFVFDGWLLNGEYYCKNNIKYTVGEDITLVALWSESTYTITFHSNGGELNVSSQSVIYGKEFTLPTPTMKGHTFIGWYLNGAIFNSGIYGLANDISLYAHWIANEYTITYDTNGGSLENYTQVVTYSYYTELYVPTRLGYTFTGWYLNGILYTNEYYEFDYDITLVASWVANEYTVNYYDGETLINSEEVAYDSLYTLMSSFTKEELTLVKWIIDGEEYNPATNIVYTYDYDLDVYAKFYELNNDFTYDRTTITGYTGTDTELVIPEYVGSGNTFYKVNAIGSSAFYENYLITDVYIPECVEEIGQNAFYGCFQLVKVTIKGATIIKPNCFSECLLLKEIVLPSSLISIESMAFSGCISLEYLNIPVNVTSIGYQAFIKCTQLKEVSLPTKLVNISLGLFRECKKLEKVTLPSSLLKIEEYAFASCESLKNLVIPESVIVIEQRAFDGCNDLSILLNNDEVPSTWNEYWNYSNCKVYYYNESQPLDDGNYWHYDNDGETPLVW